MSEKTVDREQRLVAILRGVTPEETPAVVERLIDEGFRAIEIPLNSPDPFRSIALAVELAEKRAPGACLIGAGTVLTAAEVAKVAACGAKLIVSPNCDSAVIGAARDMGMTCLPGIFTPTEAFAALKAGASGLKFFPASLLGASGIAAIRAVLPPDVRLYAVGGVGPADFAAYRKAGVFGFGLGGALYRPGATAEEVGAVARAAVAAL
ncbi:MAG: 2-dehydro-3-deoxy-6-phosphogalactonate aldolase [Pikeienuella sp.]